MSLAVTLLISASQLLALVQANPTLPQAFIDNAVATANHAISVANRELNQPLILAAQPTVELSVLKTGSYSANEAQPYGSYSFMVTATSQGRAVSAPITLEAADNAYGPSVTSAGEFLYVPKESGIKALVFKSGTTEATYNLVAPSF